jgi:hypothetical protein
MEANGGVGVDGSLASIAPGRLINFLARHGE